MNGNDTKPCKNLDFWSCYFVNSSEIFVTLSSVADGEPETENSFRLCCGSPAKFVAGSDEAGHNTVLVLGGLICVLGLIGVITNIFNITVLRKSFNGGGAFKESLLILSWIELLLSFTTAGFMTCTVIILENWNRDQLTMQFFLAFKAISAVARTWSIYLTILITIERYAIIAFPHRSKHFLNKKPWKSRLLLIGVLLFCVVTNLPWLTKYTIIPNEYHVDWSHSEEEISAAAQFLEFPFIIKQVGPLKKPPKFIREALLFYDYFLPFPLLLLFNGLLYFKIYLWSKGRTTISKSQRRDMNSAKMFSFVVLVILLTHSLSSIVFVVMRVENVIYRELLMLQHFCSVMGASANFLIYYGFGPNFRAEFWSNVRLICGERWACIEKRYARYNCKDGPTSNALLEQNTRKQQTEPSRTEDSL